MIWWNWRELSNRRVEKPNGVRQPMSQQQQGISTPLRNREDNGKSCYHSPEASKSWNHGGDIATIRDIQGSKRIDENALISLTSSCPSIFFFFFLTSSFFWSYLLGSQRVKEPECMIQIREEKQQGLNLRTHKQFIERAINKFLLINIEIN